MDDAIRREVPAEEILIEAFHAGRPIIPVLGAGISINTGFPPIGEIATYLAKVCYYIDFMLVSPEAHKSPADLQQGN